MSEPAYVNANVNINFDTISSHIAKTNQLLVSASKTTVTVDPTAAVVNATSLGLSTGNGFVAGQFGANTLVATLGIQGGIIGTPAVLNLLTNTVSLGTFTANAAAIFSNTVALNANVNLTSNFILNSYSVSTINSTSNSTSIGLASNTELATTQAVKNYVANVTSTFASNVTFNANVTMSAYLSLGGFLVNSINSSANSTTIGLASNTELVTSLAVRNYVANTITSFGSGTVTSVNASGGSTGMVFTGGPITGAGILTLANTSQLAIQFGGTSANTQQTAINNLAGSVANSTFLRGNGTNIVMSSIQVGDVPTLNQNTTGSAASITGINPVLTGGTGSNTASGARSNLGAAQSGVNIDIVSVAANTVLGAGTAGVTTIGVNSPAQTTITANYTLLATDLAKEIYITGTTAGQTVTLPSNAGTPLPATWWCQITNDSNQPWTIAVTTDVMVLSPGGTTGSRTLAAGGTAIISKKTSTRSWISGTGLT